LKPAPKVEESAASKYIRTNFKPEDRLAVVVINRKSGTVVQRLARAEKIAAPDCQRWLRYMNENNYEVYIAMNALKDEARGRTRDEIGAIRHIYLDLDHGGKEALDRVMTRTDLPRPNYVLTTSPEKYQVVWKVEGFTPNQAESLQRSLARNTGADSAPTDSARVLRLPGFVNHKYESPHIVDVASHAQQVYRPENFPQLPEVDREPYRPDPRSDPAPLRATRSPDRITQSERDWAYARRALSRGESREEVVAAIAAYRQGEKPRPQYYAEHTVDKAIHSLQPPTRSHEDRSIEKDR
jgi:hypothetical protein